MTVKEQIKQIIETDDNIKNIYNNNDGSFRNVIMPAIENSHDDNTLKDLINILAMQCLMYDTLLENIAQLGDKVLIKKCRHDINNLFTLEE